MKTLDLLDRCRASCAGWGLVGALVMRGLQLSVLLLAAMTVFSDPSYAGTISSRRLLEVADFGPPVVSPDGTLVAFRIEQPSIERNTYDSVWYVQDMDGEVAPRRVADGGVPLRDAAGVSLPVTATWSPDGRWIYYRALMDGKIDVWRAAADGSGAEPMTLDAADVREFSLSEDRLRLIYSGFSLSGDGRRLIYSVGATREQVIEAEQAEYDRGIRIDKNVPIGQGLFRSINIEGRWETQRYAGMWFGRAPLLAEVPDRWKAIDLASRRRQDLPASKRPSHPLKASDLAAGLPRPWKLAVEPGGGRIALLTRVDNVDGYREGLGVQLSMLPSKASSRPIVCTSNLCTHKVISGIQWRPGSDEVLFTVTDPQEGLAQSIFRWNVRSGKVHLVVHSHGLVNGGRDPFSVCGTSTAALVCVAAEADRPPRLERIDLTTGQRRVLFDPNAALAVDMAATARARLLHWTGADGQAFTGQFFQARTANGAPPPLFLTYYSCAGFLRGGVGDEWPLAALAEYGISSLCINDPPGYLLDAVKRYGQGLSAVQSAIQKLASEGKIDPAKVGMGGLSFGSEVTMWTVTHSNVLAAASITSTSIEPNYYLFNTLRGDAFFAELRKSWGLGAPDETPDRWREISPVYQLGKIKAPILFQMPEQEYMYSLGLTLPLVRSSRADLYVFPNEPHQKFQPKHKLAAYERNLDWFRFWLQGYEDPNPVKKQQYAHWREMRDAVSAKSARSGVRSGG